MKRYSSDLDTKSTLFKQRTSKMLTLLTELNLRRKEIITPNEKSLEKLHKRNKFSARERIQAILDPKTSFFEIGLFAADKMYEDIAGGYPAAGSIIGVGTVSGKKVMIVANDPLVKSGAWVGVTCKKNLRAQEIAMENRLPIVYMVDSAGVFLDRQAEVFPDKEHFGRIFRNNAVMAGMGIPQISCVFGFCVAGGAYLPGMSSELAMVNENACMFLAGPFLVKSALGQDVDIQTLGGAQMHNSISGVADYIFEDEQEAFDWIRDQIGLLGHSSKMVFDRIESQEPYYNPEEILGILPDEPTGVYEMREIIARMVDDSRLEEFKPEFGRTLVTAFARIGGFAVGIVANQGKPVKKDMPLDRFGKPQPSQVQMGNVIYSDSANKATHFIMLCNERKIPLLFFHDVTGFMVGRQAEGEGIIQDGAQFVNAQANSIVPKFSVVIRNSYGAGNYAMCGKAYDPRLLLAWPTAKIAVMDGGNAADTILLTKKDLSPEEKEKWRNKILEKYKEETSPYFSAARMIVDEIIDPRQTRDAIIRGIEIAELNPNLGEYKTGVMRK
jgi:3-methylcrotonyl-CoA carboxylase beta subunit